MGLPSHVKVDGAMQPTLYAGSGERLGPARLVAG